MKRIDATDVVNAYKATCRIPVRQTWVTDNQRGSCAIDVLARHRGGVSGMEWSLDHLEPNYVRGFVDAWDSDDPLADRDKVDTHVIYLTGYWDAILCRDAVEEAFDSDSAEEVN